MPDESKPLTYSQRGRIGAYVNIARNGPGRNAALARAGLLAKLADQLDPEHKLTEVERRVRARAALRAHLTKISTLGVAARQAKRRRSLAQTKKNVPAPTPGRSSVREVGDAPPSSV